MTYRTALLSATIIILISSSWGQDFCASIPSALWCYDKTLATQCGFDTLCQRNNASSYNQKLILTLLYETLCPDSIAFIKEVLFPVIHRDMGELVEIEMVPYGKSVTTNNFTVCSHGSIECVMNTAEACMIQYLGDPLPMIDCIARGSNAAYGRYSLRNMTLAVFSDILQQCRSSLGIAAGDIDQINSIDTCTNGSEGAQLTLQLAARTAAAFPNKHTGVPWIIVNNVSLAIMNVIHRADMGNSFKGSQSLPSALCSWYNGPNQLPSFCKPARVPSPLPPTAQQPTTTPPTDTGSTVVASLVLFVVIMLSGMV